MIYIWSSAFGDEVHDGHWLWLLRNPVRWVNLVPIRTVQVESQVSSIFSNLNCSDLPTMTYCCSWPLPWIHLVSTDTGWPDRQILGLDRRHRAGKFRPWLLNSLRTVQHCPTLPTGMSSWQKVRQIAIGRRSRKLSKNRVSFNLV